MAFCNLGSSVLTAAFMLAVPLVGCTSSTTDAVTGGGGGAGTLYVEIGTSGDVFKLDLATGANAKLGNGGSPCVAPDGRIVFLTGTALAETDETFAQQRVIVGFDADVERSNNGFHDPQVSPDGDKIAYTTNDDNLYVVSRSDGAVLARFEQQGVTDAWSRPTWTPDGRIVVAGGFGNPGIFVSDADLTTMTRIDEGLASPKDPAVSPDGTKIAFVLNDRVHVIDIGGKNLERVDPTDDEDTYPTWSPDGTQLAYRVSGRIKIIPATGGTPTDLFDRFPEISDKYLIFSGYQFSWR
jgi:Tol biopolymer transport system component